LELAEEEDEEEEVDRVPTPNVREMLVLQKEFYMPKRVSRRRAKGNTSFTPGAPSEGRCVA